MGTEGFAQRAHLNNPGVIGLGDRKQYFGKSTTVRTQDSAGVGLVDQKQGVMPLRQDEKIGMRHGGKTDGQHGAEKAKTQ